MKKRTAIGVVVLSVLVGIGIVGCQQSEISESLVTIDVKADYPEKELTLQNFMEVEYIPLETNDEFITQGSVLCEAPHSIYLKGGDQLETGLLIT